MLKTKKPKNEQLIEIIMFANCTDETLAKLKQTGDNETWNIQITPEILQELSPQNTRVFVRDKQAVGFGN